VCYGTNVSAMGSTSDFCTELKLRLFPSKESLNQKQIDRINTSLSMLYSNLKEKQDELGKLKESLKILGDKNQKLLPNSLPRQTYVVSTKQKMVTLLQHTKSIQKNVQFFEQVRYNLENSFMSAEMAEHVKNLKRELVSTGAIDTEEFQENVDIIADINEELQADAFVMNDAMENMWRADMNEGEELLKEFLAESDEEESFEEGVSTNFVKPLVDPLKNLPTGIPTKTPEEKKESIDQIDEGHELVNHTY